MKPITNAAALAFSTKAFFTVQKALPLLNDGGSIILTGSAWNVKGTPAFGVYGATKAAIRTFVRTWTTDLKGRHIRSNVVSPGPIRTPQLSRQSPDVIARIVSTVPMGRMGSPMKLRKLRCSWRQMTPHLSRVLNSLSMAASHKSNGKPALNHGTRSLSIWDVQPAIPRWPWKNPNGNNLPDYRSSECRQLVVSEDAAILASYRSKDAIDFYLQPTPPGIWETSVTIRSPRAARMYEPGIWVPRVSPTPLLMVVALSDTVTLTDLALAAYQRALEPKRLALIPGGHFDPYLDQFPLAEAAATGWFREHLLNPDASCS